MGTGQAQLAGMRATPRSFDRSHVGETDRGIRGDHVQRWRPVKALEMSGDHTLRKRFRSHINDRALEWFSACIMLGWSLVLALPGSTLNGPAFAAFRRFEWMTESLWAWCFGVVGAARIAALYINGRWPKTPHIRMAGSLFGALSWAQVAWLITEGTYNATGVASTGTAVYSLLALADIFSIYRARFDARYYRP